MAKFVHDAKTNRWVIIAPGRVGRSHDNLPSPPRSGDPTCPFEPENDALNEEVFSIGPASAGWKVRVIKNKYPITEIHEVIIHSPDHQKDIDQLPLEQVELILQTYRARFNFHKNHGQVLIFNNHDVHAGASISHPHSQLVVVPNEIKLDTITKEPVENIVVTSSRLPAGKAGFTVYCPSFSQWPYEIWIAPREKIDDRKLKIGEEDRGLKIEKSLSSTFDPQNTTLYPPSSIVNTFGAISDEQIADLAPLLQKILGYIIKRFSQSGSMKQPGSDLDVPYNFYIYHGPDWYLRIIPRLIHRAGFELGTGLSVNIVDPKEAAKEYREGLG